MLALFAGSLLLDQVVSLWVRSLHPEWIASTARWAGFLIQPLSSGVALVLLIFLLLRYQNQWLGLAFGGAVSNLVTFLLIGHAVDYIPVGLFVTNLADVLICSGLIAAGVDYYKKAPLRGL